MKGVTEHLRSEYRVLEVDTSKVEFKGLKWRDLGSWGKQKFENLIFLEATMKDKTPVKVLYG